MNHQSFGNYPKVPPAEVWPIYWKDEPIAFQQTGKSFLCYAQGRSYGDSCLNEKGILLETKRLNRFIAFDELNGVLTCEAGITFAEILKAIVPKGWFLPVVPGTQFISLGGAIANDIHGKNHVHAGTFGRYVKRFELLRSDGSRTQVTPQESALFAATIGGLGLTGIITWAQIKLIPIQSAYLDVEKIQFSHLEEYLQLQETSQTTHQYTVAWLDSKSLSRGVFMRANHASYRHAFTSPHKRTYSVPYFAPGFLLNHHTIKAFNTLYFKKHSSMQKSTEHLQTFFFQLDAIHNWNKLYGKRGFLQYQCVVPTHHLPAIKNLLRLVSDSAQGSFLSVLKTFGALPSKGLLSFPKQGLTLALDFPYQGQKTLSLLNKLDTIVLHHEGRVYPAKDARMSSYSFKQAYPNWQNFLSYKDIRFDSNFWRRILE